MPGDLRASDSGAVVRRQVSGRDAFIVATVLGLLAGWAENAVRFAGQFLDAGPLNYGHQVWWLTPVVNAAWLLGVAGVLVLLGRAFSRLSRGAVVYFFLFFLACLSPMLLVPRLATWAKVLLAAGLAVRAATFVAERQERASRLFIRALAGVLLFTVAMAGVVELTAWLRGRREAANRGEPRPGAPNVLLLIWDTARASSLGLYGSPRPTTPHLDRLAGQGAVFDRAMTTAPYTLPSHASLFTGRWAHELSTTWREPLSAEVPTLPEVLRRAGYQTGAFSANRFFLTEAHGLARGFDRFDEHAFLPGRVIRVSTLLRTVLDSDPVRRVLGLEDDLGRVPARANHRKLVRWLTDSPERPWFAAVNFMDAHAPYLPPPPFDTAFGWYDADTPPAERRRLRGLARRDPETLPPDEAGRLQAAYDGAIAALDAATDSLLTDLRARGLLQNTIVILVSDHGEEFGEHGLFGHSHSLYPEVLHVPLVIVAPERVPSVRVRSTVSIRDIPATVLDLAGLPPELPGRSLSHWWTEGATGTPGETDVFAEVTHDPRLPALGPVQFGDLMAVVNDTVHAIRNGDGTLEAFDLRLDPRGKQRLLLDSAATAALRSLIPASRR